MRPLKKLVSITIIVLHSISSFAFVRPICPSSYAIKKTSVTNVIQASYDQKNRKTHYTVQNDVMHENKRNWIVTVGLDANSKKEAVLKANRYLRQISGQPIKESRPNRGLWFWICSWKIPNSDIKVSAITFSVIENG